MAYKKKEFIPNFNDIYSLEETFELFLLLDIDICNAKRILINKNPKLLSSLQFYFKDVPFAQIYHLCKLKTVKTPVCIQCGKTVDFKFKTGFNQLCKSCKGKLNVQNKKIGIDKVEESLDVDFILKFIANTDSHCYDEKLYKENKNQYYSVIAATSFLVNPKFNQRLWHIKENKFEQTLCQVCGSNHVTFLDFNRGYSEFCSSKCSRHEVKYGPSISKTKRNNFFEAIKQSFENKNLKVLSDKQTYIDSGVFELQCKKCSDIFFRELKPNGITRAGCLKCNKSGTSLPELRISEFIQSYGFDNIKRNDKSVLNGKEIDILVDELNFGIEYNGLYWHSEQQIDEKNSTRHLQKTSECISKGVKLFHIFENEWLDDDKNKIWKSMILSALQKTDKLYARKCKIKTLSNKETADFLNKNHLQGAARASVKLGLFYDDNLVSVLTLAKPRFTDKYDFEIVRFCNALNTTVVGAFSKLLSHFEKLYPGVSIITYANLRYSTGEVYSKNGFEYSHQTKPNYFYYLPKDGILQPRQMFQKHKLKEFSNYSPDKTEHQIMFEYGYRQIFDCGNLVFTKNCIDK